MLLYFAVKFRNLKTSLVLFIYLAKPLHSK